MSGEQRSAPTVSRRLVRMLRAGYLALLDARDRLAGRTDALAPPRTLHFVGGGDFRAVASAFLGHFRGIGGLGPDDHVLDIGCGTGRMAVPLLDYLSDRGSYAGFDVSREAIEWCTRNVTSRNARFKFVHADIHNLEYNPGGAVGATQFRFPCEDGSMDFAFATSVFTHLRQAEIEHYLDELRRVLRSGGRALVTFFIYEGPGTPGRQKARPAMNFQHPLDGGWTIDSDTPERAIAYAERWIRDAVTRAGLEVDEPIRYGAWSGRADSVDFQDMILLRRVSGSA